MLWETIRTEADQIISRDPSDELLSLYIRSAILNHPTFQSALVAIITVPFETLMPKQAFQALLLSVYDTNSGCYDPSLPCLVDLALLDIKAFIDRDPASVNHVNVMLNFKGFKALQTHRIAHCLWHQNRREFALLLQSLGSQAYGVDIHPAAVLGSGLMLDHGSGIVIGETAVVGNNCSFLHGVTLGSSGKQVGNRHPKIGNNVLIGCNATILGNITLGDSCKIGSGSIVTKSIPSGATAVGNPARVIGRSTEQDAAANVDWALKHVETHQGMLYYKTWSVNSDGSGVFEEVDVEHRGKLDIQKVSAALTLRFNIKPPERLLASLFSTVDEDHDGFLNKREFEQLSNNLVRFHQSMTQQATPDFSPTTNTDHSVFLQSASFAASSL